jgi:hypothetical protein
LGVRNPETNKQSERYVFKSTIQRTMDMYLYRIYMIRSKILITLCKVYLIVRIG